jgi:hypothetical protein
VSKQGKKSQAEKLYETLKSRTGGNKSVSENEMIQLLSHPLISEHVEDTSSSGGSHQYIVRIKSKLIQKHWGHTSFNVVVKNRQCKKSYVDDVIKYIDYLIEEKEIEEEEHSE